MERRANRRLPANDNACLTSALAFNHLIRLQNLINEAPWSLVPGLNLVARQCEDGILVFDSTRNVTHLIAGEAWKLYCILQGKCESSHGVSALSVDGFAAVAHAEEIAMYEALETAGLLKRC